MKSLAFPVVLGVSLTVHSASAAATSTLEIQNELRALQAAHMRSETQFDELAKILPRLDVDPLARARGLEFFDRSLAQGLSWPRKLPADLGEVIIIFYFDLKGERESRSIGVFRGTPDSRAWSEVSLIRNGLSGNEVIDLTNQAAGVWLGQKGGASGLYQVSIERGVGKDSERLEIPLIARGCEKPGRPPQVAIKWLDGKRLEITVRAMPEKIEPFEKSEIDLLIIDQRRNQPIWSVQNPKAEKVVVELDRGEARNLVLYATKRVSYALLPVRVMRETRRILPLDALTARN